MNWLDILLIIVMVIILIGGIIFLVLGFIEDEKATGFGIFGLALFGVFLVSMAFIVVDRRSGATIGEITSVDKNYFGTTAVYVKVNNNSEEKYCIENKDLVPIANEYIGKKVKITYGKRVGVYSTGACSEAPIDTIELIENN